MKKELSFVYSEDVAKLIENLIDSIIIQGIHKEIINQSYNLAFDETVKLPDFLKKLVIIYKK